MIRRRVLYIRISHFDSTLTVPRNAVSASAHAHVVNVEKKGKSPAHLISYGSVLPKFFAAKAMSRMLTNPSRLTSA